MVTITFPVGSKKKSVMYLKERPLPLTGKFPQVDFEEVSPLSCVFLLVWVLMIFG